QAETAVGVAFGLPGPVDLNNYNPFAQPAGDATALAVQKVNAQLDVLATLGGAGAFAAVADLVAHGGTVNLASDASVQPRTGLGETAATRALIAQGNQAIAAATSLQAIAVAQALTLHDVT